MSRASRLEPMFATLEKRDPKVQRAALDAIANQLAGQLRASDVAVFGALLERGVITDPRVVDKLAFEVLGTLLERASVRADVARELAGWRSSLSMWQRRAACLALAVIAPQGDAAGDGFVRLAFTLCSTCVWSIEHADQTAVGSLLRELSHAEPARVDAFVHRHARFMSRECIRVAINRLPGDRQRALRAHWKRATTLRR